jgi:uncharacterized protein YqeY
MSLKERITEDMKTAMRGAQKERLGTVRMILAAIKQREVDERVSLDDSQILAVIDKMVKQGKESITSFQAGGRADLVAKEAAEIVLLQGYLPAQLTPAEIETLINAAIASTGAASIKEMGKVMGVLKSELAGRADMGAVSARIKQKLS